jgi:hypothetical protein
VNSLWSATHAFHWSFQQRRSSFAAKKATREFPEPLTDLYCLPRHHVPEARSRPAGVNRHARDNGPTEPLLPRLGTMFGTEFILVEFRRNAVGDIDHLTRLRQFSFLSC